MKSKSEFLQEYRNKHPEYKIYLTLQIVFDVIGALVIIFGIVNWNNAIYNSDKQMYLFVAIIGAFLFLIGFVFLKLFQNCDHHAILEWEKYIVSAKSKSTSSQIPNKNEWKCPKCGTINQNYIGTCGCGAGKEEA